MKLCKQPLTEEEEKRFRKIYENIRAVYPDATYKVRLSRIGIVNEYNLYYCWLGRVKDRVCLEFYETRKIPLLDWTDEGIKEALERQEKTFAGRRGKKRYEALEQCYAAYNGSMVPFYARFDEALSKIEEDDETPIKEFQMSRHARKMLEYSDVLNAGDMKKYTARGFFAQSGVGRQTFFEICIALERIANGEKPEEKRTNGISQQGALPLVVMEKKETPSVREKVETSKLKGCFLYVNEDGEILTDESLLEKLYDYRRGVAKITNVPCFFVASNKDIVLLATEKPKTKEEFLKLKGFGESRWKNYGKDIVEIIKEHEMKLTFDKIEVKQLNNFYGGEGTLVANMYVDENIKILRGKLAQGASIGLHTHLPTSEVIFILSGKGKATCDGKEELLVAGDCHYCPKGSEHTLLNAGEEDLTFYAVVPKQ